MGHQTDKDPTIAVVHGAMMNWLVVNAELKRLVGTINAGARKHGEVVLADDDGTPVLYTRRQQVYYDDVPTLEACTEALGKLLDDEQLWTVVTELLALVAPKHRRKVCSKLVGDADRFDAELNIASAKHAGYAAGEVDGDEDLRGYAGYRYYASDSVYLGTKPLDDSTHIMLAPGQKAHANYEGAE